MKEKGQQTRLETHDPLIEETRAFWREVGKDQIRASLSSVDEAAKQIIGVTAILEVLYFNAITFGKLQGKVTSLWPLLVYIAPIVLLLVSLSTALFVFFPMYYHLNLHSSEGSRDLHEKVVKRKMRLQTTSAIFLILSIVALLIAVMTYLHG